MSRLDRLNEWIGKLPTTNWVRFVGSLLIAGTAVIVWTLALLEREFDHVAFAEWLTFLAAIEGISYRQFKAKRETNIEFIKAKNGQIKEEHK